MGQERCRGSLQDWERGHEAEGVMEMGAGGAGGLGEGKGEWRSGATPGTRVREDDRQAWEGPL